MPVPNFTVSHPMVVEILRKTKHVKLPVALQESEGVTKVFRIHCLGTMNISAKSGANPSRKCHDNKSNTSTPLAWLTWPLTKDIK